MTKTTVTAPMPGVFYRRPDPEEEPFVEEGDRVSQGDAVCMIGVMKNFHEIEADADGLITRFIAENEQEVAAGDDLLELEVD